MATSNERAEYWTVCYGTIGGGFNLVGTFDNPGDAVQWATENINADAWWVVPIVTLNEFDEVNA